jgi:hypothetical protein
MKKNVFDPIRDFDSAPGSMMLDITSATTISRRSRSSLYRDAKAGRIRMIKVGSSTRIRVSDIRSLING